MDLLTVINAGTGTSGRYLLHDINFSLQQGQRIAIAGETGSGKTSLLKVIAGLLPCEEGTVLYQGQRVRGPFEKLIPGHPQIAYLSQYFELRNNYRVEEELESKNKLHTEEARNIYRLCRIDHLLKRKTTELSGGERQRIVLAGLLTTAPRILLLDEPFSNLDAFHKATIRNVLQDINHTLGTAMIMVSHDPEDILPWAQQLLILKNGKIVQQGTPATVYRQPADEYCAGLSGAYNLFASKPASQFFNSNDQIPPGKQLLVRPEDLLITDQQTGAVSGVVEQVLYYGASYMVVIRAADQLILVRQTEQPVRIGDSVALMLREKKDHWFI